ncbi:Uncharacterized protein FWK35_00004311 [Aphis craccivora]|uniref:Uncharacterized protein n=1 Tax=Aphis craccivora TaxID=307492 RepID=A0A6G0ZC27_APHCR|nr:Uncharacterized protein FWK35_00004311 [Aphis craccivora]
MRFGIQSVGTLSGRSSRINAATGTFDVGRRTDELLTFRRLAHGEQGRSVRQPVSSAPEEPGFARWLLCHNKQTAGPVFCDGTGKRLRAITNHRPRWAPWCAWFQALYSKSQATVDVATTAITNRKTSAGDSGDNTTPPPINASAERKIARPTQADLRGSGTTYKKTRLAVARPTQGRLEQFGRFCLHNLTVARPTKGRLAQFCCTVKPTKTSTKKIPQYRILRRNFNLLMSSSSVQDTTMITTHD